MVIATGIIALWAHAYYSYGVSALFKPISEELGFKRATTSVAAGIGRFEGGVEAPLAGWITDKFGPKWVVILGISAISSGLILMNFISTLWAYYLVWGVMLGTGINISTSVPVDTAISNWFVKKRGLALSTKMIFAGLSGVIGLPFVAWLITSQGWRTTCVIGGVVMAVVGLPLAWFFLREHRPEYYGLLPDGAQVKEEGVGTSQMIDRGVKYAAEVQEVEFTLKQAMRTPPYWLLIAVNTLHGLVHGAINVHCIPFLTDRGIEPVKAAGMMSLLLAFSIPARPLVGFLADRIKTRNLPFLLVGAYSLEAIGLTLFLTRQTTTMIYVWFMLYGFGYGAALTLMSIPKARYFGRKAFGSIIGTSTMFQAPAAIAAPVYAGWVYDTTGNYIAAFTLFALLLLAAIIIAPFARPPKPPALVAEAGKTM